MRLRQATLGILAAALLLAVASFAGIKPSNNATRQEVESDTTLAVKGILDIESGGSLKFAGSAFTPGDYVPVTKAGQQSITATGAGNDITLTAADEVVVSATGSPYPLAFRHDGETFLLEMEETGAGSAEMRIQTTNTVDDYGAWLYLKSSSASSASAELRVEDSAGDMAGRLSLSHDGAVTLSAAGQIDIGGDGGVLISNSLLQLTPSSDPPAACAGGTEGGLYLDSDTHLLCVCNGTGWVQVADGTTACS